MAESVRVASVDEIPPGSGKEVVAGDRVLAVFNVDGRFFAVDGVCAHAGGPVAQGKLEGTIVTCPWHGWQYDVTTGLHCLNAAIRLESFPVEVEDGAVYVKLP